MPIVVFAGRKGGCGKTTGATNFAAWLAANGHSVALLDTDPERAAASFAALRAESGLPALHCEAVSGETRRTIISLASEFTWVVVDTPGLDSLEAKRAIGIAGMAIYPCKTSMYDLKTIAAADSFVQEVQAVRPEMMGVVYFSEVASSGGTNDRLSARAALEPALSSLTLLDSFTVSRKSYRTCANAGMSVFESTDTKAATEFDSLAREIVSKFDDQ